jgi:CRP/FNR family transcriptional regulator, cyclic AMP receptor protein
VRATPIRDLLAAQRVFDGLDEADLELLAGCGRNEVVPAGATLAREGDPADRFYVVRRGRLAVQLHAPSRPLVLQTAGPGEVVGWSWIFPPWRWGTDVAAPERTHLVAIDGRCLRDKSEADPGFGYRLMQRFAEVMARQLDATQLRLLDLYGERAPAPP